MPCLWARQWSTRWSGPLASAFSDFLGARGYFRGTPVVHSTEWTTSSGFFCLFGGWWPLSGRASGPLDGVDHWLRLFLPFWGLEATFRARQWSTRPSGPLAPAISAFLKTAAHKKPCHLRRGFSVFCFLFLSASRELANFFDHEPDT